MRLNRRISIFILVFVGGCVGVEPNRIIDEQLQRQVGTGEVRIKNVFGYASECRRRSNKNTDFCHCVKWADDESGDVPEPAPGMTQKEYEEKAEPVFMGYFSRMERCDELAPFNMNFFIPENTNVAKKVLRENEGSILTPDNLGALQPISYPVGWAYRMAGPNEQVDFSAGALRYKGMDDDGDVFVYTGTTAEYVYISGVRYFKNKTKTPYEIEPSRFGECTFVIGACVYGPPGDREKVVTRFEDGVWIRNVGTYSLRDRRLHKVIYDLNGIPLYHLEQSPDFRSEEVRHETVMQ